VAGHAAHACMPFRDSDGLPVFWTCGLDPAVDIFDTNMGRAQFPSPRRCSWRPLELARVLSTGSNTGTNPKLLTTPRRQAKRRDSWEG